LITDLSKAYELLGVKPGVSSRELKAAHRDLAKVWHPDRFVHDPRLQEKAQEKLKEINEAYELVSSGKTPRPTPAETVRVATPRHSTPRTSSWKLAVVPVFLFAAVFAVTTKVLLERRSHVPAQPQVESLQIEPATQIEPGPRSEVTRKSNRNDQSVPQENSASIDAPAPTPALATVTVLIDPENGLLAKADCPVRSRMTYPTGSQPSAYCNINHTPPPKDSKIKSVTKKILH
jgi:hypothetical protein